MNLYLKYQLLEFFLARLPEIYVQNKNYFLAGSLKFIFKIKIICIFFGRLPEIHIQNKNDLWFFFWQAPWGPQSLQQSEQQGKFTTETAGLGGNVEQQSFAISAVLKKTKYLKCDEGRDWIFKFFIFEGDSFYKELRGGALSSWTLWRDISGCDNKLSRKLTIQILQLLVVNFD